MLKFALKKARLDFTGGWITPEHIMQEQIIVEDFLGALFVDERKDAMDQIICDFSTDDSNVKTNAS